MSPIEKLLENMKNLKRDTENGRTRLSLHKYVQPLEAKVLLSHKFVTRHDTENYQIFQYQWIAAEPTEETAKFVHALALKARRELDKRRRERREVRKIAEEKNIKYEIWLQDLNNSCKLTYVGNQKYLLIQFGKIIKNLNEIKGKTITSINSCID